MREMLRESLAGSLRRLPQEDRLAAALPVVCGPALAGHCRVLEIDPEGTLHLEADGEDWLRSLVSMRDVLQRDLERVAGVPLRGLRLSTNMPARTRRRGHEHRG